MQTRMRTPDQERVIDDAYLRLAHEIVFPACEALRQGERDVNALLFVAFSPLVHALRNAYPDSHAADIPGFLRRLVRPPSPASATRWLDPLQAWYFFRKLPRGKIAVAFDLRPGGGCELAKYPYVALVTRPGTLSPFHEELLRPVVAVLRGWGTTVVVVPPPDVDLTETKAHWAALTAPYPITKELT